MEGFLGILKIRIKKGIDLAIRDTCHTSDPYVVLRMYEQKLRTKVVKDDCNPEWNEELTLYLKRIDSPIELNVFDKDTYTEDDPMGKAEIDIKPLLECAKMNEEELNDVPNGCVVKRVQPSRNNYLSDESCITWIDGKLVQEMFIRLKNVERGEILLEIEWNDENCIGLSGVEL
ncbi:protein C2-DOMAIN ABA-RELATED 9-like [Senna tora]|uniref:Protein C2-DOMAIN ABA-RELATED 9-like n=1 Tax=Senna tora TaxID=362788 RepID=A0A834WRQ8_9FABA|nr:protein C2-DOMAIN ABA-RELATED 9-like [Senna tora]